VKSSCSTNGLIGLLALCKLALDGELPVIACMTRRGVRDLELIPGGNAVVKIEPEVIHRLRLNRRMGVGNLICCPFRTNRELPQSQAVSHIRWRRRASRF
jgi:hypothetical protein